MKLSQQGFTLIELIVVIVILGILAATALPRFVNIGTDARRAAVEGIAGGLRGSVAAVQGKWYATGNATLSAVAMADGQTVDVVTNGVPSSGGAGIGIAFGCPAGTTDATTLCNGVTTAFNPGAGTATFQPSGGGANCRATFNAANGQVTTDTTVCP